MSMLHTTPADVACPTWCDKDPGHGYRDDPDDGRPGFYRVHTRAYGASELTAELFQDERAAGPAGPILRDRIRVHLDHDYGQPSENHTAAGLRQLATALTACAVQLDELNAVPDHDQLDIDNEGDHTS